MLHMKLSQGQCNIDAGNYQQKTCYVFPLHAWTYGILDNRSSMSIGASSLQTRADSLVT